MSKVKAQWSYSLDTRCPRCQEDFDVLDTPDFWDGRELQIGEVLTTNSWDVEIACPGCGHEFTIDLEPM